MISMDKKYRYRNGEEARILCVDRPEGGLNNTPVASMDVKSGYIYCHYSDGTSEDKKPERDLIEISPYDHINIDDKVLVWRKSSTSKVRGHFAGVSDEGLPLVWLYGRTSWSVCNPPNYEEWDYCEKVEQIFKTLQRSVW